MGASTRHGMTPNEGGSVKHEVGNKVRSGYFARRPLRALCEINSKCRIENTKLRSSVPPRETQCISHT